MPVLESLKRLLGRKAPDRDLTEISQWALRRGHGFKRARHDAGFVIDGLLEGKPWRIEWGPTQRPYITGFELRIRMELALPSDLQMLVMSRRLMDALERATFEQYTDHVQTQMGASTPEEMRWLVMFPKVDFSRMKMLRARFGAVAIVPEAGLAWIEGALAHMLEEAGHGFLRDDPPFVVMTLRNRAYLRMQLAAPHSKDVAAALAIFETAVAQAVRTAESLPEREKASKERPPGWSATGSSGGTAWQTFQSDLPGDSRAADADTESGTEPGAAASDPGPPTRPPPPPTLR